MPVNPQIMQGMAQMGQRPTLMQTYRANQAQKQAQGLQMQAQALEIKKNQMLIQKEAAFTKAKQAYGQGNKELMKQQFPEEYQKLVNAQLDTETKLRSLSDSDREAFIEKAGERARIAFEANTPALWKQAQEIGYFQNLDFEQRGKVILSGKASADFAKSIQEQQNKDRTFKIDQRKLQLLEEKAKREEKDAIQPKMKAADSNAINRYVSQLFEAKWDNGEYIGLKTKADKDAAAVIAAAAAANFRNGDDHLEAVRRAAIQAGMSLPTIARLREITGGGTAPPAGTGEARKPASAPGVTTYIPGEGFRGGGFGDGLF